MLTTNLLLKVSQPGRILNSFFPFFFVFLFSINLSAQPDSIFNTEEWKSLPIRRQIVNINRLMAKVIMKDKPTAKLYLDKALEMRDTIQDTMNIMTINFMEADYLRRIGKLDRAEELLLGFKGFHTSRNDTSRIQQSNFQLADVHFKRNQYDQAISLLMESLDYKNTPNDVKWRIVSRLRIMYQNAGYHNLEKEVFQKHIAVLDSIIDPIAKSSYYLLQADYLIEDGELDEAEKVALQIQSINAEKKLKVFDHRANLVLQRVNYHRDGKLDIEALKILEEFFNKKPQWYLSYVTAKLYLAKALIEQGEERKAYDLMQKAYDRASKTKDYRTQKILVEAWIEMLEGSGQIAQSNKVLKYYQVIQDSIQVRMKRENFIELERKYQTEKKEEEISKLSYEAELSELALKKSNQQRLFFILAAIGLLAIAILAYRQFLIKRKAEALLAEKNSIISSALSEKELLLKEIHHRVKNNLQVVSSLLGLQSEYIKDDSALSAINEGRNRVRSMALIHQNLYSEENLTGINVRQYLETLIEGLFDSYNISADKIKLELNIQDLDLDVDTVVPLGLIANELVSNALKHAFTNQEEGKIIVGLEESDDILEFSVIDNGKGMDTSILSEDMESFGYQMISAFKEKLNADLDIDGNNGTSIKMSIKDFKKH